MRKFIVISIPFLTLAIFITIMISDNFLKYPFGVDDDVPGSIRAATLAVQGNNWNQAKEETLKLSKAFDKMVKRIQFSAEKDEIDDLEITISRLQGAITAKDKANALIELKEAYKHWDNIGR